MRPRPWEISTHHNLNRWYCTISVRILSPGWSNPTLKRSKLKNDSWPPSPPASTQLYSQQWCSQHLESWQPQQQRTADNSFCNCVTCCAITIETIHKAQHWKTRETSIHGMIPEQVCYWIHSNRLTSLNSKFKHKIKCELTWGDTSNWHSAQHGKEGNIPAGDVSLDVDLGAASSLFWYNPCSHYRKETPLYTHIPQGFTIMDIRWRSCLSCLTSLWTKGFDTTKCLHGHPSFHQCSRQSGRAGLFPVAARSFPGTIGKSSQLMKHGNHFQRESVRL